MIIFDFRLQVFHAVATRLSFTKAALMMNITQPAVTKHISELEHQLGDRLFNRHGNNISLTPAGQTVLNYAEKIMNNYTGLLAELAQLHDMDGGIVRIGASTTVAQTILPKLLAQFKKNYPAVSFTFTQGNSDFISQQLIAESLDIAIVEGAMYHPQISYSPFVKDEVVLVTSATNKLAKKGTIDLAQLPEIPLVMREAGSGTLDVIMKALNEAGFDHKKLTIEIQLESSIAIKQYVLHSDTAAFLSIQSIVNELKYNELSIIDINGLDIFRDFRFIQLHGRNAKLIDLFKNYCISRYNLR